MAFSRRSRGSTINIWPGFVDALTQLTMVIVFLLLIFTVGQYYLSGTVSTQDAEIRRLSQQINQLNDMLGVQQRTAAELKQTQAGLSAQLQQANTEKDTATAQLSERDAAIATLNENIESLKKQLADISAALDLANGKTADQEKQISDLGAKLNAALASKVEELARYRSEFFGRLRQVLGDRPDIRVVGDRFVFQSEVLFAPGSADLSDEARTKLAPVASALKDLAGRIPADLGWVLEIDGHTDKRPINTPQFPSNWELSTARAVSVVRFMIDQGIPSDHLAAAGFGEYQPLDGGDSEDAYRKNRRIELKLTQR
ncbi:MAG TPA: peptidoglycan -binding protein [Caulobacteraceae bacterium]|nr:peptidoglycan -binding protein [Caulobacteraceae bacterium]